MNRRAHFFGRWFGLLVTLLILVPVPRAGAQPPEPVESGVPAEWWTHVRAELEQAEYFITWQDQPCLPDVAAAYQAPNRAENLRTYFAASGPILIPRLWPESATEPPWRLDLRLEAWGRQEAMQPVPEAELEAQDNRIEYRRGPLVEWYRNQAEGIAVGFLVQAPTSTSDAAPLSLAVGWSGGLGVGSGGGPGITFAAADQIVLRLGSLTARDSAGTPLPVHLSAAGQTLTWQVDDGGAIYPVEVEGVITGLPGIPDWSLGWGQANTNFGVSVATAGDVNGDGWSDIIVGADHFDGGDVDEGKAFVFLGHPLGLPYVYSWEKEGDQPGAQFGFAVAGAGDVNGDGFADVIIGAPEYDHPEGGEGGAWVYHGSADMEDDVPDFFAQSNQADAALGYAVATAGDVNGDGYADVIVGALSYSAPTLGEGTAWVWHGSSAGVNRGANGTPSNADWHAESNEASTFLGISVGTAGDVNGDGYADVIVGSNQYGAGDGGAAFVWHSTSNGVNNGVAGTPTNAVWSDTGAAGSHFGRSVATAGDVNGDGFADIIVGAPHYTSGETNEGAAYLYLGSSEGLTADPANQDQGNRVEAWFGQSVACAGDVNGDGYADVVVGAPLYTNDQSEEGRAFLWYGSASGISATRDWWAEGDGASAWYGNSVATAGDVNGDGYSDLIIGAYGQGSHAGGVYVYHGGPDLPSETADWAKRSNEEDADFGFVVASAGDVNADGYADVIVGAPLWDSGGVNRGGAWVYRGSASGLVDAPYWHHAGRQDHAQFGYSVAGAGDVDGDGYADVVIGAPYYDSPQEDEGAAWVYYGSLTGVGGDDGWAKASDQAGAEFGYAVGTAGDVNGDGYADVIVGAPRMDHGQTGEGVAWLYLGSEAGLNSVPAWHAEGDHLYADFGAAVGTAGDVDADGYSDVVVGAPFWEDDADNEGRILVYHGSSDGLATTFAWDAEANRPGARLGHAVATAGDVNGDGYSDVIAGAPYYGDEGLTGEGKVWVFYGSGRGMTSSGAWAKESNQNYAYYGYSVGTAGDVNGDGLADILIGAPAMDRSGGPASEGLVRLYLGSFSGVEDSYAWTAGGEQANPWYGVTVSSAGDVNGDGYADIVVGAKDATDVVSREGMAFVYYGNQGGGVPLHLQQFDNSGHPLANLGHSDTNAFRLALGQYSPFGRGEQMYEIEVKPLGQRLTGSSTFRPGGVWSNPVLGTSTSLFAGNLHLGTAYHWRLRVLYNPATTPWMPASRWVTVPWNGWNEPDLRTAGIQVWLPLVLRNYP